MLFRQLTYFGIFGFVLTAPTSDDEKTKVDELISRLSYQNVSGGSGVLMLPPTFSVDIWSLLRSAIQQEIEKQSTTIVNSSASRSARLLSTSSINYYPQSNLDLVELGGKNYFFSRHQLLTWIDAASFCRLFNMDLVSVETREEDLLIIKHLESIGLAGKVVVYTSGNKAGSSNYQWINGKPIVYSNWFTGQPAQPATEHCLVYWEKTWHDFHCGTNPSHFICEQS